MDLTLENVEKLIYELYHNSNVSVQSEANHYLTLAQISPFAWQFLWHLLDPSKPIEVQYFGASTLYLKVSKCMHELDNDQRLALKNRLVETLISYMSVNGARIVETRLSLALAAYVVHSVSSYWENAIDDLVTVIQPSKLSHLPVERVLHVLIDLITIIPEEFQSTRMNLHDKTVTRCALTKFVDQIFVIIHAILSQHPQMSNELQQSAIKCFSNWTEKMGHLIFAHNHEQILELVLNAITNDDLCPYAVDALINIYSYPEIHKHPNTVLNLIDKMVRIESVLNKAIEESNVDVCSSIYNLFIQISETHSRLLLDTIIDKPQHRDNILKVITVILQCSATAGHYPTDETYSEQAFNFWYTLQDDIIASDEPRIQMFIALFNPLFHSLIDAFLVKVQYPPDDVYEHEWGSDDKESFRCYRQDIGDSFMYCYNILRVSMLSSLLSHFSLATNQLTARMHSVPGKSWQYLEAVIYTFGSIAENVNADESVYLPQIFNALQSIPFGHVTSSKLLSATMDALAAYSEWISVHHDYLPNIISMLILGLKSHHYVTVSASMALKDITRECQLVIKPHAEHILLVCKELLQPESQLRPKERSRLMCTVGIVLSVMPVEVIMDSMNQLLHPIVTDLQSIVNQYNPNNGSNAAVKEHVSTQLGMIAMLFSTLDINLKRINTETGDDINIRSAVECHKNEPENLQPIFVVLQQCLPLMANIAYKWSSDEAITESLCDCIKKSVITLLFDIKPLVNDILQMLIHLYSTLPQSSILDTSKQLIILFGKDPDLELVLKNYYVQLCAHTMSLCQHDLRQQTALIEMFYSISTHILKKVPSFYHYNLLNVNNLFRCALSSLILPEKPTVRSTSVFLSEFINYSREVEAMAGVVNAETENLIGQIFIVIGGTCDSPRTVIEHTADILMSLNQKYFDNLCRCMNLYVQRDGFPSSRTSREQKEHFVRLILKERKNKRKLKEIINEFGLSCRGLIATEYGNQIIKLPF